MREKKMYPTILIINYIQSYTVSYVLTNVVYLDMQVLKRMRNCASLSSFHSNSVGNGKNMNKRLIDTWQGSKKKKLFHLCINVYYNAICIYIQYLIVKSIHELSFYKSNSNKCI